MKGISVSGLLPATYFLDNKIEYLSESKKIGVSKFFHGFYILI